MNKKIRAIGAIVLVTVWVVLTGFAWFAPAKDTSDAERRPLAQMPRLTVDTLLSGKFMTDFEAYTLDQFPLRDGFRTVKSMFHYYGLNQSDNNGIYIADGYAAKLEYPLKEASLNHAVKKFENIYETYLKDTGSTVIMSVVPDKGYYLAEQNGYLAMDYDVLFAMMEERLPWASCVDITDCLTAQDYYRTDTHWRQERLLAVAQRLSRALGVTEPAKEDYTVTTLERPFYGVYYGQAALPMDPERMYLMENDLLSACTVYHYETQTHSNIYDKGKLNGKDMYDVYLSGAQALLRVDNLQAATDKELIVFRDSFGSSLVPLLMRDYKTVTLVDIRYIGTDKLADYLEFNGQDVLFLYSTLVLNNSSTLK